MSMSIKRQPQPEPLQADLRAREKQCERAQDANALASGSKSPQQLRRENEAFGPLAAYGAVRLFASRSLG